ncbi:zinc finger domain-containing protein [Streptomyces genisteinicus]|uniref:DNA-binding phage zinc finger domain-containing protein n=1 Tax=Streptomyces genisteinicus TaxID=2768068 RepID=A0A7H0HLW1_9ACTN|nr:hypothetical protein [Streptomyces genisteinicus]QNP61527.1 hypothetical protein IAG43_00375 [Streptomyces genisteinicus]
MTSAILPSPAADAAHDAAHTTAARFRHGVYAVPCTTCHVPAGALCLARRSVHPSRREAYRVDHRSSVLVPLLVGRDQAPASPGPVRPRTAAPAGRRDRTGP